MYCTTIGKPGEVVTMDGMDDGDRAVTQNIRCRQRLRVHFSMPERTDEIYEAPMHNAERDYFSDPEEMERDSKVRSAS